MKINQGSISIGTTSAEVLGYNPKRVALIVSCTVVGNLFLHFQIPVSANNRGILLPTSGQPILFTRADYGAVLDGPIECLSGSASNFFNYVEVLD